MTRRVVLLLFGGVEEVPVSELLGKTVTSLEVWGNMEELRFSAPITVYFMYHEQDAASRYRSRTSAASWNICWTA